MDLSQAHLIIVASALVLGGMLFFAAVFAPLVFVKLPGEIAGKFIRSVFPWYYGVMAVVSFVAALVAIGTTAMIWLGLVAAGFAFAGLVLMPAINTRRDRQLAGDQAAGTSFEWLHRTSVLLNTLQMLLLALIVLGVISTRPLG